MTRPRRSTRITGRHHYHEAVRPCAPHQYSTPSRFFRSELSLPATTAGHNRSTGRRKRGTTGSHVPYRSPDQARATSMPETTWAVLGYPPGSSRTIQAGPVSISSFPFDTSAVVPSRSPSRSIPAALNGATFPQRSPPRLLTAAACGGLQPPPEGRLRRTTSPTGRPLHLRYSTAQIDRHLYSGFSSRFVFTPWIWLFSSTARTTARSGGFKYRPQMSWTFSMNCGSLESLKRS
jgi:hypothetical protein